MTRGCGPPEWSSTAGCPNDARQRGARMKLGGNRSRGERAWGLTRKRRDIARRRKSHAEAAGPEVSVRRASAEAGPHADAEAQPRTSGGTARTQAGLGVHRRGPVRASWARHTQAGLGTHASRARHTRAGISVRTSGTRRACRLDPCTQRARVQAATPSIGCPGDEVASRRSSLVSQYAEFLLYSENYSAIRFLYFYEGSVI